MLSIVLLVIIMILFILAVAYIIRHRNDNMCAGCCANCKGKCTKRKK